MFEKIIENVNRTTPLVHCITNYVTVNDCANVLLACGGSPIMADDNSEAEEITTICKSLYINIGTLNDRTILSMLKAGRKANALSHPVILDPVGAGASTLRTDTAFALLANIRFSVIRGNISEIRTLASGSGTTKGVDADISDIVTEESLDEAVAFAKALSAHTHAVIVITGEIDIVADSKKAFIIRNGHPMMRKVSGTGCMLTAVIAAFCGANQDNILDAAAAAVCMMGVSGELAHVRVTENHAGISTYRTCIIDEIGRMDAGSLEKGAKIESR